jgi:hypothetical protein
MPSFRNTLSHLQMQVGVEWLGLRNVRVSIWENVWLRLFSSQIFSRMDTPLFLKPSHSTTTCLWRSNRVFRNVKIQNSDTGELPRIKNTTNITFLQWQKYWLSAGNINQINKTRIIYLKSYIYECVFLYLWRNSKYADSLTTRLLKFLSC